MLPEWMTPVSGRPGTFTVDPDIFYPLLLKDLGVEEDAVTQFDLEVAYGCMKLDAARCARMAGALKGCRGMTLLVRGDDGRKLRWNHTMHPPGELDITADGATAARNRAVRVGYRRIRGA